MSLDKHEEKPNKQLGFEWVPLGTLRYRRKKMVERLFLFILFIGTCYTRQFTNMHIPIQDSIYQ